MPLNLAFSIIFATVLKVLAFRIMIAHNHPSGNLQPSESDKRLTQRLQKIGKELEILLLDHLIYTDQGYFSFADEGIM